MIDFMSVKNCPCVSEKCNSHSVYLLFTVCQWYCCLFLPLCSAYQSPIDRGEKDATFSLIDNAFQVWQVFQIDTAKGKNNRSLSRVADTHEASGKTLFDTFHTHKGPIHEVLVM